MAVDSPHAHLIRIRWSTAPGQAKNLRHSLAGIRLHARVERHNLVVLDTLEAVAGLLLRLSPTLLLQQDLEELLAADRAIVMGRRATPEQLTRRAQAVRAVLARLPPMPEDRKRKPRRDFQKVTNGRFAEEKSSREVEEVARTEPEQTNQGMDRAVPGEQEADCGLQS